MPLKHSLLVGILSFCLLSCGSKAPPVTWCFIDSKAALIICQPPEGEQFALTIDQADNFVCQPLADASKVRDYVLDLERRVASCH